MATCPSCGAENLEAARFCASCGLRMDLAAGSAARPSPAEPPARRPGEIPGREPRDVPGGEGTARRGMAGIELSTARLRVDAGSAASLELRVRNNGPVVDEFSLEATGVVAAWATIVPPSLALMPGTEGTAMLTLRPPRDPSLAAGDIAFEVRAASRERPETSAGAHGIVTVGEFRELVATLTPQTGRGRRAARFTVRVQNRGNARLGARLTASDPDELLVLTLAPERVGAGPGETAEARLTAASREPSWFGRPESRPFRVDMAPDAGPAVSLNGTYVALPLLPAWLLGLGVIIVALAVLLAGALGGWLPPDERATPTPTVTPTPTPVPLENIVTVTGSVHVVDDELLSRDEVGDFRLDASVILHGGTLSGSLLDWSRCVGDEVVVDIELAASVDEPGGEATVTGTVQLREGSDCQTLDVEDTKRLSTGVPQGGATPQTLNLLNRESNGGDTATVEVTFSNAVREVP